MARLMTVVAFAAMLALAFAQTNSVNVTATTTVAPSPSTTMAPTTTSPTTSPTMSPTPTPLPPVMPPNNTYTLKNEDGDGDFCLRMQSGIALNFTYLITGNKANYSALEFESNTMISTDSFCNSTNKEAMLILEYAPNGQSKGYYLTMNFTGSMDKNDPRWELSHLMINFTFNATEFPGYTGKPPPSDSQTSTYTNSSLFDETNSKIEYTRSFKCDSRHNITGFESFTTDDSISVALLVDFLQVQAFQFKNATTGDFDNARVCLADNPNTGNKIVPIAVGAALAGLVIVVLIAYLIGRLRNRRKSSYEALS